MNITRCLAALVFLLGAPLAGAQSCVGFVDLAAADPFCPNVEWIKNRSITLGCTDSTHYCPTATVNRLAMAAFMNRLGTTLTPATLYQEAAPGAVTISTTGTEHCVTAAFPVTGFPRAATLNGSFAVTAAGAVTFRAVPVYSTNGGASWTPTGTSVAKSTSAAGQWSTSTSVGAVPMSLGQTYLFAVRVLNESGSTLLADSRCQLSAVIDNRNSSSSPLDFAPEVAGIR